MDEQYYMRVRGRVLGPFDWEKLQSLSLRGQLSRAHEVSTDRATWIRAAAMPELFTGFGPETTNYPTSASGFALPSDQARVLSGASGDGAAGKPLWYYAAGGREQGPVEFSRLQQLAEAGQLSLGDLVWHCSLTDWTPAAEVAGLKFPTVTASSPAVEDLPRSLCTAAISARQWVVFMAVACFIAATLLLLVGMSILMGGTQVGAEGVAGLVTGVAAVTVAFQLLAAGAAAGQLCQPAQTLTHSRHPVVLEKALVTLRQVWVFAGVSVVGLVLVGTLLVWIILAELRRTLTVASFDKCHRKNIRPALRE